MYFVSKNSPVKNKWKKRQIKQLKFLEVNNVFQILIFEIFGLQF